MLAGLFLGTTLLLQTDAVQRRLADRISEEIQESYGIPIEIEKVGIKNFKEFSLEKIHIRDQQDGTILKADNAMASISLTGLIKGDLHIYTLSFASPDIHLSRASHDSPLNIQFIIDELSKERTEKKRDSRLRINQLIVYDGKFSYDVMSEEYKTGRFDPYHIAVEDFDCNLSLKNFHKENLNLNIRSISGEEKSGLRLNRLKGHLTATGKGIQLSELDIELPGTSLTSQRIDISYSKESLDSLSIEGDITSPQFSINDLRPFLPDAPEKIPTLSFSIDGRIDHKAATGSICIRDEESGFTLDADANILSPYSADRVADVDFRELRISSNTLDYILSLLNREIPDIASLTGDISAAGKATVSKDELTADIALECLSGATTVDMNIKRSGEYTLTAEARQIALGRILNNSTLGNCNLNIISQGNIFGQGDYADFKASIESLRFKGYRYAPIRIQGKVGKEHLKANVSTNDRNLKARLTLDCDRNRRDRATLKAEVSSFNPNRLRLTDKYIDNTFSFNAGGYYGYTASNDRLIKLEINDLVHDDTKEQSRLNRFQISEIYDGSQRNLNITSDFLFGTVNGKFRYSDLVKTFTNAINDKLPALAPDTKAAADNSYAYRFTINDTRFISRLLNLPLTVNSTSIISGECNDMTEKFALKAELHNTTIKGSEFPTIKIEGKNSQDAMTIDVEALNRSYLRKGTAQESINDKWIVLSSHTSEGNTRCTVKWNSCEDSGGEYGMLSADASLGRDKHGNITLNARINPTDIIHNGAQWQVSAGEIKGTLERLSVKDISIYNDNQSLGINGIIGKYATDNLNVTTRNMEVGTLMGLTNFRAIRFGGKATGSATMSSIFSKPEVDGNFNVDSMRIDGRYVGRGDLNIGWSDKEKAILLDCDIHNDYTEMTRVNGFLSPVNDTIILKIDARKLNVNILENKLRAFVCDLDGIADGTFYILGGWRAVDLVGNINLNTNLRVTPTNTVYTIENGDIQFTSSTITFNNIALKDRKGNSGRLNGSIGHKNFSNWTCDLKVNADKLIVYDTNSFDKLPFYGTVYATGDGNIMYTLEDGFKLSANLRSEPGAYFAYNSATSSGARDNSFVTFVDKSKKKSQTTGKTKEQEKNIYKSVTSKLNLDFMLDITEDFHIKVFTNLNTNDYIDFYGNGKVNAIYDERTGFSMRGTLDLDRGTYKFTIQDIFPKEFKIDKGSELFFDGDPFNAGLKLTTRLHLPSVPLNDLNTETSNKTTKVDCVMNIGGTLSKPQLKFDIELPEANEEERDLLASVASTQEQKDTQFIYLLGIGKFYTYDYNKANNGSESSTAVESLISTTLSSQLNNALGRIINNDNWDFSGNFSTSERGWNRMEVEGMLRGRLLNNRLIINGNFGYRDNPIANSNFIGDFEIQYLLDKKGIFSTKAYSKTNDRYFTESDLTTQGMGFLVKYDFNRWLFWRKKDKSKKSEAAGSTGNALPKEDEENITTETDTAK